MATRDEIITALDEIATRGDIKKLAATYCQANEENRSLIEPAILKGIEVCERNQLATAIANMILQNTGLSEAIMLKGIEVCGRNGRIKELVQLLYHDDLNDALRQAIQTALVKGIEVCGSKGWVHEIPGLLNSNKKLGAPVVSAIEPALLTGLKLCQNGGNAWRIAEVNNWRKDLSEAVRKAIEPALLRALDVCEQKDDAHEVTNLLERVNLSDAVMIKGIQICARKVWITEGYIFVQRTDLSAAVRKAMGPALLDMLEACKSRNHYEPIETVLGWHKLSDAVMLKAMELCGDRGSVKCIYNLIERKDLSPAVRKAIEPALLNAINECERRKSAEDILDITTVLNFEGLSDEVKIRAIEVCIRDGHADSVVRMLEQHGEEFSDAVVARAMNMLPPRISAGLTILEAMRNPLAEDGVAGTASAGFANGPGRGKKPQGKTVHTG